MKKTNVSRKTFVLASVFAMCILCGVYYFFAVSSADKTENGGVITYANLTPIEKQKLEKELELKKLLNNFDKKNIVESWVFLGDSGNDISSASIFIVSREEITDSTQKGELMLLASESLNLDSKNINIEYMDVETFTTLGEAK